MKHTELTIHTTSEGSEIVQGILISAGVTTYSVEDPNDFMELLNNKTVPWDYIDENLLARSSGETVIKMYIPCNGQGNDRIDEITEKLATLRKEDAEGMYGTLAFETNSVDDEDWADTWKQYFHPLEIGKTFVVKPSWEEYSGEGRKIIEIDPESSFGTGQHETTALCLECVEKCDINGKSVLDMGCGSGILGIGALLSGARDVVAVDIEENSARIAKMNMEKNGIESGKYTVLCGNVLEDAELSENVFGKKYGVILANIVADVIVEMLPLFKKSLDGTLVCSGIISPRSDFVINALEKEGFTVKNVYHDNGWVAVVAYAG